MYYKWHICWNTTDLRYTAGTFVSHNTQGLRLPPDSHGVTWVYCRGAQIIQKYRSPRSSRCQKHDTNLVLYWGHTYISRHRTKFSRPAPREGAPAICVPLATSVVTASIDNTSKLCSNACWSFPFNVYNLKIYVFWDVTPCSSPHMHLLPINMVSHIIRL
jgi:hypothetical protein